MRKRNGIDAESRELYARINISMWSTDIIRACAFMIVVGGSSYLPELRKLRIGAATIE